jgi:hypothetical protein
VFAAVIELPQLLVALFAQILHVVVSSVFGKQFSNIHAK